MTLLDSIQANPLFSDLENSAIEVKLISRSIDGSADFNDQLVKELELVSADLYLELSNVSSIKEGQLGITYDSKSLRKMAKGIYKKYNDPKFDELFGFKKIEVSVTKVQ